MTLPITKRQIILCERKWYWTKDTVRQYVREVSDTVLDRFPPNGILHPMTPEDMARLMAEPDHGPLGATQQGWENVADFTPEEYCTLYQGVFLRDEVVGEQLVLPRTPLTLKMDRYCMTPEGILGVFKLADMLLRYPQYYLRDDNRRSSTAWLKRIRLVASKTLRHYHTHLTKLSVDKAIVQGTRLDGDVGQVFAIGRFIGQEIWEVAHRLYPGDLETEIVKVRISPLTFTILAADEAEQSPFLSPRITLPREACRQATLI